MTDADKFCLAVGRKVRARRRAQGISLPRLAQTSGVSKGTLSKWENHGVNVCMATLYAVANALEVMPGALLRRAQG